MSDYYLCISVTFLDPFFHGRGDSSPEWPPSPLRLFSALVNGSCAGCHIQSWPQKEHAFRWLEALPPPEIIAPKSQAQLTRGYRAFVPNNDSDANLDRQERLTGKVYRPHYLIGAPTVHYLWSLEQPSDEARLIASEARRLLALGWGIDVVVGDGCLLSREEARKLAGERWQPTPGGGDRTLRVPCPGTLEDAQFVHAQRQRAGDGIEDGSSAVRLGKSVILGTPVAYRRANDLPGRPWVAFALEPPDDMSPYRRRAFWQSDAARVAAMLRHVTLELAKKDSHSFPNGAEQFVAGHLPAEGDSNRFSYLALPSVGHPYADGLIRRVLIAAPYGSDEAHIHWAERKLNNRRLIEHHSQVPVAYLTRLADDDEKLVRRYVERSRDWVSVTPVLLPGYDDGREDKAASLVYKAIRQAGLSTDLVASLELRKSPFLRSSEHVSAYFRPAHLRDKPAWHVRIAFKRAIPGPFALGTGRHVGLGLFVGTDD
ncbi:MAG: type I-U CRISPR-associated protein Cas5/Cas6 [Anaerolineae bacterium]|jgi:CRISPR-associated protein Csb2|nr:type I-U CRISPR-associated protein Cas5/Cas6 [Anaerolineae bacterium]